jgi:DNA polymerase/3'-5' exonuclease PolX
VAETTRIPLAVAQQLADEVVELLDEWSVRLAVAGSVRRGRADVGDVEVVAEPIVEVRVEAVDLFADRRVEEDLLHARCRQLLEAGVFAHRPDKNGHSSFGTKAKRLLYRGVALDVFSASELNWGVILLLRTGPAEFNRQLVLRESRGGWLPRGFFFRDGHLWRLPPPYDADLADQAVVVPTPEERSVFDALGYAYVPPERRGEQRPARLAVPA